MMHQGRWIMNLTPGTVCDAGEPVRTGDTIFVETSGSGFRVALLCASHAILVQSRQLESYELVRIDPGHQPVVISRLFDINQALDQMRELNQAAKTAEWPDGTPATWRWEIRPTKGY